MDLFLGLSRPLQLNVASDAWSEGGQFFLMDVKVIREALAF